MYELIPKELRAIPKWICWRGEYDPKNPEKPRKVPINPHTGGMASSTNPTTWTTFDHAVAASGKYSGIGFVFDGTGYFGIDLDRKETELNAFLSGDDNNIIGEFIHTMQSYTERSQSGTGIHIICKGHLPEGRRRNKDVDIEMYDTARYFVFTGDICAEYAEITDGTESVKPLYEKYLGQKKRSMQQPEPQQMVLPAPLSVSEVIEKACRSKQGEKFKLLMRGDYEAAGYNSQSEGDMALCSMLAFWCRRDAGLMDTVFRQSGLMRPKWDRKTSGSTYGAITIQEAIQLCQQVYSSDSTENYTIRIGDQAITMEPIAAKQETFDDMGNARRLITASENRIRFHYTDNIWLLWDGCKWAKDDTGGIFRLCDRAIALMVQEQKLYESDANMEEAFKKHMKKSRSYNSKRAMEQETKHLVPVTNAELNKRQHLLNTPGGIVNLKDGSISPCDPKQYMTMATKCKPADTADCPRWQQFLQEIFCGDGDLIRFIQKAVGYSLTGSTAEQCVFFLHGNGSNGKSTFIEILRYLFGSYATNVQAESIMKQKKSSSGASGDIARLADARFVTSAEPSEGMQLNEGLLKQISGEDLVTARKLYGNEFEFTPRFKLWMSTNHKPIIRGTDNGVWRRIRMIPFTACFDGSKKDKTLKYKLVKELPGILRWAIDGCLLWQQEGLTPPRAVQQATDAYRAEMDVVSAFLEACCTTGKGETKASTLYSAYCQWASINNEYRMSNTRFGAELSKKFEKIRKSDAIYFIGILLENQSTM